MTFYQKGVGRPTHEEQVLIDAIYRQAEEKGISVSELPMCHSTDDLAELLRMVQNLDIPEVEAVQEQTETEHEQIETVAQNTSVENESPLVVEEVEQPSEEPVPQQPSPKELETSENIGDDPGFIAPDYDPFAEQVAERNYTNTTAIEQDEDNEDEADEELETLEDEPKTPDKDLSPKAKRRAAEQTANVILKGYAQLAPIPFKWLSKIPEEKVERMAFDGELDLTLEVSEGTTFDEYMRQTNEQIDELFEVDEDTLDDIREPLIDVLMEQQLELTPTQRLVMAVISHLGQMLAIALKLRKQNNRILAYQQHLTYLARGRTAA